MYRSHAAHSPRISSWALDSSHSLLLPWNHSLSCSLAQCSNHKGGSLAIGPAMLWNYNRMAIFSVSASWEYIDQSIIASPTATPMYLLPLIIFQQVPCLDGIHFFQCRQLDEEKEAGSTCGGRKGVWGASHYSLGLI